MESPIIWFVGMLIASITVNVGVMKAAIDDKFRGPAKISLILNTLLALVGGSFVYFVAGVSYSVIFVTINIVAFYISINLLKRRDLRGITGYESQIDSSLKQKYPLKSIVGIMRVIKNKTTLNTAVILTTALLILGALNVWHTNILEFLIGLSTTPKDNSETLINSFTLLANSNLTMIIILCAALAVFFGDISFEYRVAKGQFGNNEREAREIIDFIIKESDNIDFTDGGKLKQILSESDLEEIQEMARQPLPEGV
jgi:hypothetical protein